ncbi:hypothetical protein ACIBG4_02050 [Nonomuraea sp. NPDC050383]|uniref:hypothetical protein n=1 Tax=Nonomuraea sp. NPDC050383 TaxID=3364362 RepID=UPI00379241EF
MMYGPDHPGDHPRASSSPVVILLVSGLTGLVGFVIGFLAGFGATGTAAEPAPRMTVRFEEPSETPSTAAPEASEQAREAPRAGGTPETGAMSPGMAGAGRTLVVGVDIQPGTYRTAGPAEGQPMCYWARLRSTVAQPSDVIAADMPRGPATVVIAPTDKAFQTGGCADWTPA